MRIRCLILLVLIILYVLNTVSAVDSICRFNGSVNITKGDLPAYFSDQVGCGVQNASESMEILVIACGAFVAILMIYGVFGRR